MDELTNLVEDVLGSMEMDHEGNYLIQVYVPEYGTYEWFPVTEEMAELLTLLEAELNGSKKKIRAGRYKS